MQDSVFVIAIFAFSCYLVENNYHKIYIYMLGCALLVNKSSRLYDT
jgi:hypothetical protein